jgi:hypothetical protein
MEATEGRPAITPNRVLVPRMYFLGGAGGRVIPRILYDKSLIQTKVKVFSAVSICQRDDLGAR